MDVVLLKDVDKLGTEGVVVRVKPGYARNYLMPRGLAAAATPQQLKALEGQQRQRAKQRERLKVEAEAVKQKLESRSLTLTLTLGDDGQSFGSITAHDVVEALARAGIVIEKHMLQLEQPIKSLGTFEIPVRIHSDVTASLKLSVVKA